MKNQNPDILEALTMAMAGQLEPDSHLWSVADSTGNTTAHLLIIFSEIANLLMENNFNPVSYTHLRAHETY